jgi:hypothetical protein
LGGDDYGPVAVVDEGRAKAFLGDADGRKANALKYLNANLLDLTGLAARPPHHHSWRDKVGKVDPPDTLRRELLSDLITQYTLLRDAVERFQRHDDLGTGGSLV